MELDIDYSHCRFENGENGYTIIQIIDGERVIDPGNYGGIVTESPLVFSDEDIRYIKGFQLVHTSVYSGIDEQIPVLAEAGIRLSYDFSCEYTEEKIRKLCPYLVYGLFSCEEMDQARKVVKYAKDMKLGCAVATVGKKGAVVYSDIGYTEVPGLKLEAEVIDTMACGDSFITGFLLANEISENMYYANLFKRNNKEEISLEDESYYKYVQAALTNSIYQGHLLAAKNCLVRGAFGYGVPIDK